MLVPEDVKSSHEPEDFYDQLRNIVVIKISASQGLEPAEPTVLILAVIQNVKVRQIVDAAGALQYQNSPFNTVLVGNLTMIPGL